MVPGMKTAGSGDYDIFAAAAADRPAMTRGSCLYRDALAWIRTAETGPVDRSQRGCRYCHPHRCQLARIWADRDGERWRPTPQIQPATESNETMPRRLGRSKMMRQKPKMAACA